VAGPDLYPIAGTERQADNGSIAHRDSDIAHPIRHGKEEDLVRFQGVALVVLIVLHDVSAPAGAISASFCHLSL